MFYQST